MKFSPASLGKFGEAIARWFYRLRGYTIVARNLRLRSGEIDIVAKRGNTLVIAEVKTRQTRSGGEAHEAVDRRKRERLIRLGDEYAAKHPTAELRYDVLSMFWKGWWFELAYYANAFQAVADSRRPWIWRG
jgi:putative endonuclease